MSTFLHDAPPAEIPQDAQPGKPPGSWRWFWGGFLLVFVFLLFAWTRLSQHPSVQYAFQCSLWQYYVLEFRHAEFWTSTLGPRSGSESAAVLVAAQHLAVSLAGGLVALGVGRFVRSRLAPAGRS